MKIVFVSNFMNHHQTSFCDFLYKKDGIDFCFIATTRFSQEGVSKGYKDMNNGCPYIVKYYENDLSKQLATQLINEADAVIFGAAPVNLIKNRIKRKKLVFLYYERPLKKGFEVQKYLYRFFKWHLLFPNRSNVFLLCAGAFVSNDYSKFGMFINKCFKWGYYPEFKSYDIDSLLRSKIKNSILWSGRLIDWKHPDDLVELGKMLKTNNYDFTIKIIGSGYMEGTIEQLIKENNLEDVVVLNDAVTPNELRKIMEKTSIYIQSSDKKEGWGSVLNEAMNSGCAVVASDLIGSSPYLIENEENGLIYHSQDINDLYIKVKKMLDNPSVSYRLGSNAYKTIKEEWNSIVAGERLIILINKILNNEDYMNAFDSGPCSVAEILKEDWYYDK